MLSKDSIQDVDNVRQNYVINLDSLLKIIATKYNYYVV